MFTSKSPGSAISWALDENGFLEIIPSWNIVLMQFTGLKDKNGKEIYEGDVLKWGGYKGEVSWRVSGFEQCMLNSSGWHLIHDEVEIIGNICENPNL